VAEKYVPPPNLDELCKKTDREAIEPPELTASPNEMARYKVRLLRQIRDELHAAFMACLANGDDKLAKALASLKQAEIRTVVEECKTLGSDKGAAKTTDEAKGVEEVMRQQMQEAGDSEGQS
jgi:hypothetical protein